MSLPCGKVAKSHKRVTSELDIRFQKFQGQFVSTSSGKLARTHPMSKMCTDAFVP